MADNLESDLNKFDPIKGIETPTLSKYAEYGYTNKFKQIWPDKGDWNLHP